MLKPLIIASAVAAVIAGAVSMASANNSSRSVEVALETSIEDKTGIVVCADQVWPAIDAYCLKPASELGELRQARLIRM